MGPQGYNKSMRAAWGEHAEAVMGHYPLALHASVPAAAIDADADAYVVCPSRKVVGYAAKAGRRVWVSEFAHFKPSTVQPLGCSGCGPHGCKGFGCDNGVELDVVPGHHTNTTKLWATHGAEFQFIFGTVTGPDGVGPNQTFCFFDALGEQ